MKGAKVLRMNSDWKMSMGFCHRAQIRSAVHRDQTVCDAQCIGDSASHTHNPGVLVLARGLAHHLLLPTVHTAQYELGN
jgi:hypothetical protein